MSMNDISDIFALSIHLGFDASIDGIHMRTIKKAKIAIFFDATVNKIDFRIFFYFNKGNRSWQLSDFL